MGRREPRPEGSVALRLSGDRSLVFDLARLFDRVNFGHPSQRVFKQAWSVAVPNWLTAIPPPRFTSESGLLMCSGRVGTMEQLEVLAITITWRFVENSVSRCPHVRRPLVALT